MATLGEILAAKSFLDLAAKIILMLNEVGTPYKLLVEALNHASMLGKRKPSASLISMKKRRKSTPSIEEISFDFSAREDYLTGFHKRKLQRIKHAKLEAAKKERQERIAARKIVRYLYCIFVVVAD